MSKVHVYIKPFASAGTYESSWTEVTDDVCQSGLGKIKQKLDNTEYDVGIFRNSSFKFRLKNDHGKYSDIDGTYSIFAYRRANSQVKVTWEPGDTSLAAGFFVAGDPLAILSSEVELFRGLLKDNTAKESVDDQIIEFYALGFESIFDEVETPYAAIGANDNFDDVLYDLLNVSDITDLLSLSASNINTGTNSAMDLKDDLENTTIKGALNEILLPSNSVLYVNESQQIIVSQRTAGATLSHTFYGSAASDGVENFVDIKNYSIGVNRVFNYLTWKDTTLLKEDATSIGLNGVRKKEIDCEMITTEATRNTILENLRDEFKNRKVELDMVAPLNPTTAALFLLDKVNIDFPSVYLAPSSLDIGIYEEGLYGTHRYAYEIDAITIDSTTNFKIMGREIDFKKDLITFHLREA